MFNKKLRAEIIKLLKENNELKEENTRVKEAVKTLEEEKEFVAKAQG